MCLVCVVQVARMATDSCSCEERKRRLQGTRENGDEWKPKERFALIAPDTCTPKLAALLLGTMRNCLSLHLLSLVFRRRAVSAQEEAAVAMFQELLRIRTVSFEGPNGAYREAVDWLTSRCKALGLETLLLFAFPPHVQPRCFLV